MIEEPHACIPCAGKKVFVPKKPPQEAGETSLHPAQCVEAVREGREIIMIIFAILTLSEIGNKFHSSVMY